MSEENLTRELNHKPQSLDHAEKSSENAVVGLQGLKSGVSETKIARSHHFAHDELADAAVRFQKDVLRLKAEILSHDIHYATGKLPHVQSAHGGLVLVSLLPREATAEQIVIVYEMAETYALIEEMPLDMRQLKDKVEFVSRGTNFSQIIRQCHKVIELALTLLIKI